MYEATGAIRDLDDVICKLRREFCNELRDEMAEFQLMLDSMMASKTNARRLGISKDMFYRAHKLKGTGAVLGLMAISKHMAKVESACSNLADPSNKCFNKSISEISAALETLRKQIEISDLNSPWMPHVGA